MSIAKRLDEFAERQGIKSAEFCKLVDLAESLQATIDEMKSVISFYGDKKSWRYSGEHAYFGNSSETEEAVRCKAFSNIADDFTYDLGCAEMWNGKKARSFINKHPEIFNQLDKEK